MIGGAFLICFQELTRWQTRYGNCCLRSSADRLAREKWPLERITVGHPVNFELVVVCRSDLTPHLFARQSIDQNVSICKSQNVHVFANNDVVAKHPLLTNPKHGSLFPTHWRTLYELSKQRREHRNRREGKGHRHALVQT